MNEISGSILELTDKKALIMTESCDFISIAREPQMFVGQQIKVRKSDIPRANKGYVKYALLAASIFVLALFSVFYFRIFVSSTVYAYIDVDINPSVEFSIDRNAKVLDLKPLNSDAEAILNDMDLVDLSIKDAIKQVVKTSEKMGFIGANKENAVLISAAVEADGKDAINSSEAKALDKIITNISDISFNLGYETIKPEVLKVTPENRKAAIKNNISMGRFVLYSELEKGNTGITVEKARTTRVSDMIKKSKDLKKHKNKIDNSTSKYTESDNSNPITNEYTQPDNSNHAKSENDNNDSAISEDKHTFIDKSVKAHTEQNSKNNESDKINTNSNSNKKSKTNNKDGNEKKSHNSNSKKDNKKLPISSDDKKDIIEGTYNNEKANSSKGTDKPEEPKTTPSFNPNNDKNTSNNTSGNEAKPSSNGSSNEKAEDNNNYKNNKEQDSDKPSKNETRDNSTGNNGVQENHGNGQSNDKPEHGRK